MARDFFLADDLSGALDAAAAFHGAGRAVTVRLSGTGLPTREAEPTGQETRATPDHEVTAYTTETRNATDAIAARSVADAIARGHAGGGRLLFKKIDSTLRGPVVAEVRALLAALPEVRVLFTPANPRAGRTVRDGVLRVHGVPVAETEFGRDPVSPVRESSLRVLLREFPAARLAIADVVSEEDLVAAVAKMNADGGGWVGVGSGALAAVVAGKRRRGLGPRPDVPAGPALIVCGSTHPVNRAQAAELQRERGVPAFEVALREPMAGVRAAVERLRSGGGAALLLEPARGDSAEALQAIVRAALHAIETASVRRLFVMGGETAFGVCGALGVRSLQFVKEIEPGASVSAVRFHDRPALVAMKNGGFGDAGTWVRVWDEIVG